MRSSQGRKGREAGDGKPNQKSSKQQLEPRWHSPGPGNSYGHSSETRALPGVVPESQGALLSCLGPQRREGKTVFHALRPVSLPKLSCLWCSPKGLESPFICLIFIAASMES